jgi:hypothetical protein
MDGGEMGGFDSDDEDAWHFPRIYIHAFSTFGYMSIAREKALANANGKQGMMTT